MGAGGGRGAGKRGRSRCGPPVEALGRLEGLEALEGPGAEAEAAPPAAAPPPAWQVFIWKDLGRDVGRIDSIPSTSLDTIKVRARSAAAGPPASRQQCAVLGLSGQRPLLFVDNALARPPPPPHARPPQDWLTSIEIKYYESKVNLNWKNILKSIKEVRGRAVVAQRRAGA